MRQNTSTIPETSVNPLEFKIAKILVPLDFSPASMEALDYAVSMAKQFHASIHLVHVYPPDEASAAGAGHLLFESAEAIERLNEELTGIYRKHAPTFRPENCHICSGRPYEETVRVAREIDADLIVLSTRGHSGLKHLLLGSTAERVVRNAPCPVPSHTKTKKEIESEQQNIRHPYHSGSHRFLATCSSRDGIRRVSGKESSRHAAPVPRDVSLYELRVR